MQDLSHLSSPVFTPVAATSPLADHSARILVIGGGASGVLMAAHLLRADPQARVTLIEGAHPFGCGVAYSTTDPDHLLNTRVRNMSAFADTPGHFLNWLQQRPETRDRDGDSFVGRATYGAYLSALLSQGYARLVCLQRTCLAITEQADGVTVTLDDGTCIRGGQAVLATGHILPRTDPEGLLTGAWTPVQGIAPEGRVVIVGSGLSMVDQVVSLLNHGHAGPIVAVSRRGQMPRRHAASHPMPIAAAEVPFGAPVSELMRWARHMAARAEAAGGTWRDAVDGIRVHVAQIWQHLPIAARDRFLRHATVWWDVHRHRIPPVAASRIEAAIAAGQLVIERGSFRGATRGNRGEIRALVYLKRVGAPVTLEAACILDCRGIRNDPERHGTPLIRNLLAEGLARVDPLHIGLDVDQDCRLIARDGLASRRIRAIGPVSRAAFWEITAVPDIRDQTAILTPQLLQPVCAGE
ncbi:MAG TPA: FAD/NAD(P)-binding protein [Paenirhodobacter sp.]